MTRFVVASILVAAAMPAFAQAPQSKPIPTADTSDANRIVCKKEEGIGSRLAVKKVCLTVQEWKERADHHRDSTERIQQATPVTPSG